MGFEFRPILEQDVEQVIQIFKANYGASYPYQDFYEPEWVKRGIYNDDLFWLVGTEPGGDKVLATASLMLEAGDHDDLCLIRQGIVNACPDCPGPQTLENLLKLGDAIRPRIEHRGGA